MSVKVTHAVWKWRIPLEVDFTLEMPRGAEIVSVQTQQHWLDNPRRNDEHGSLWALVDPDAKTETRRFQMVGTGNRELDPGTIRHVGTYQLTGGSFVAHIFEVSA